MSRGRARAWTGTCERRKTEKCRSYHWKIILLYEERQRPGCGGDVLCGDQQCDYAGRLLYAKTHC